MVGQDGSLSPAENGVVHPADLNTILDFYLGESTPAGAVFNSVPLADTPILSVSFAVVPEPGSVVLAACSLGLIGLCFRQRQGT